MQRTLIIGTKQFSSWSLRPWLMMKVAKIPFEEIVIPLRQESTIAEIRHYSPSSKVPLLKDGTFTIWDSLAIAEYLSESFPEAHLWPKDKGQRSVARSIVAEMHSGFSSLRQECPMDVLKRGPCPPLSPSTLIDIERIETIFEQCLQDHSQGPFLFGHFTIADAFYAPVVSRFLTYSIAVRPTTKSYCETIFALPEMQHWINDAKRE
jgi:glutathione S-transferase